ncbi:alpha/beta hydrolase family protein [Haladaptatus cibarius]|uniref:alpha/beta hydrolase family protein n=1 Tax=Haladaptatus cibarius TaxID=453847 RepID=UPI00067951B2|nr:alpha/beta hydrolase [Haladaptatus cibarius]
MTQTPTRRRVLQAVGTATVVSLAGCSSDSDDETATGTTGQGITDATTAGTGSTTGSSTTSGGDETADETTGKTTDETTEETTGGTEPQEGGGDVQFTTSKGTTVQGTLLGDGSCGVVFAHGDKFNRRDWRPQMETVANKGYACLSVDLNFDDRSTTSEYLLAAIRYLRERAGVTKVVLFGAGTGADAVVKTNARAKSGTIDGNLILSAEGPADAAEIQGWSLFVVSQNDNDRFVQATEQMHENASGQKRLEKLSGSAHGQAVFEDGRAGDHMMNLVFHFLGTVCGR